MMRLIALFLIAAALPAASPAPSPVAMSRAFWEGVSKNITAAAEQVPEASYGFKPVATVRSFGQLIGHIAGTQNLMCGTALGEKTGEEDDIEKTTTTKATLVAALKASNAHCAKAYAISDADAAKMVKLFGEDQSALQGLLGNAMHDGEHYGNIVTYMRVMGMVPPSSQPAPK